MIKNTAPRCGVNPTSEPASPKYCIIARGETLAAVQKDGLRLLTNGETLQAAVRASADPAELGPQDYVIIAVKAPSSNVRVAWSGVGVNIATNEPTQAALREAVRTVLDTPRYRTRAAAMADEFRSIDTRSEILRIINQVVYGEEAERGPELWQHSPHLSHSAGTSTP